MVLPRTPALLSFDLSALRGLVLLDFHRGAPTAVGVTDPVPEPVVGANEQGASPLLSALLTRRFSQVLRLAGSTAARAGLC